MCNRIKSRRTPGGKVRLGSVLGPIHAEWPSEMIVSLSQSHEAKSHREEGGAKRGFTLPRRVRHGRTVPKWRG
jgi:hypothetical protein